MNKRILYEQCTTGDWLVIKLARTKLSEPLANCFVCLCFEPSVPDFTLVYPWFYKTYENYINCRLRRLVRSPPIPLWNCLLSHLMRWTFKPPLIIFLIEKNVGMLQQRAKVVLWYANFCKWCVVGGQIHLHWNVYTMWRWTDTGLTKRYLLGQASVCSSNWAILFVVVTRAYSAS